MQRSHSGKALVLIASSFLLVVPSWADLESLFANKKVIQGVNVLGRGGLLFQDTAEVPELRRGSASTHILYGGTNSYDDLTIPFGVRYGPMKNLEVSASVPFINRTYPNSVTGELDSTGLGVFTFGGKYMWDMTAQELPDFGVGANIGMGPLSDDVNGFGVDWNLKGIATYRVPGQGITLNGSLGLIHSDRRTREVVDGANHYEVETQSDTDLGLSIGAALAFTDNLSGIVEAAANELGPGSGILAFGVRGGRKIQYQGFVGPGLGGNAPDYRIGGGVMFPF